MGFEWIIEFIGAEIGNICTSKIIEASRINYIELRFVMQIKD